MTAPARLKVTGLTSVALVAFFVSFLFQRSLSLVKGQWEESWEEVQHFCLQCAQVSSSVTMAFFPKKSREIYQQLLDKVMRCVL